MTLKNHTNKSPASPAQLWVGPEETVTEKVTTYLQKQLCTSCSDHSCVRCAQIEAGTHHAVRWFSPEKQYTREVLADLFTTISYRLDPGEQFFFVLQRAETLSLTCANSLLKPIEEPPPGYHFILLTQRQDLILPTIRSRCVVSNHGSIQVHTSHITLFEQCTSYQWSDPSVFLTALEKSGITETESADLIDEILRTWIHKLSETKHPHNKKMMTTLKIIQEAIAQPPMPGGSKIFWKNLFLCTKMGV